MTEDLDTNSKHYDSMSEMIKAGQNMFTFQKLHNHMKASFDGLLAITMAYGDREQEYKILIRSCLIELFGIIEADIFYYNSLDKHPPQDGTVRFYEKFRLTFDQIGLIWNKKEIVDDYFKSQGQLIRKLRKLRNNHVHPKQVTHLLDPDKRLFKEISICFRRYDELIGKIMDNFFVSTTIPIGDILRF